MTAKIITSLVAAAAMAASLSVATPADALNQDQRNIVGGIALGVLGTMAVQNMKRSHQRSYQQPRYYQQQPRYYQQPRHQNVCYNPVKVWRHGKLVTVCR
ncbi:hypothetical protein [Ponticoccus alexandrii]|uniref:Uncharacterized protein n=1 Tax=Ponticoccus alexandrii TaxID=1943633 RepID=A0ABX7F8U5_9RHOB|nr:hypothetical protein [Ponticoccus alexandrii]ETA52155.1 hypothetical protein P279_10130 [Rhodobacteraceae bacterium PD-2]QRF66966.1 hypothetical protein GQA70_11970 [Ponticoccus alexandrii]